MTTSTRIELDPDGCRLRRGALAPRRLQPRGTTVRIGLVATEALLLAGDAVRIDVVVRVRRLELVEIGGTVAYDMRDGRTATDASWEIDVHLADGADLVWHGEPFVVATGADVRRSTTVRLSGGSTATLRERLVLGRTGESGGRLRSRTRASAEGEPLLVEDLDLAPGGVGEEPGGPAARAGYAVLGPHRVLDSVTSLGRRLPDGDGVLQLAGEGSVARWLGDAPHLSPLG